MAVLVLLMQRRKRSGTARGRRAGAGGRWRGRSGEGGRRDEKVGRLVGERLRAALAAAEESRGAEKEAEGAMGRPGPL